MNEKGESKPKSGKSGGEVGNGACSGDVTGLGLGAPRMWVKRSKKTDRRDFTNRKGNYKGGGNWYTGLRRERDQKVTGTGRSKNNEILRKTGVRLCGALGETVVRKESREGGRVGFFSVAEPETGGLTRIYSWVTPEGGDGGATRR